MKATANLHAEWGAWWIVQGARFPELGERHALACGHNAHMSAMACIVAEALS